MNILINCSNLSGGGGVQVADSVIRLLNGFLRHHFIVVLPTAMESTANAVEGYSNLTIVRYNYPAGDWKSLITNRNKFLDSLVDNNAVDCVLTIFGPMKWRPKCKHVCGFAMAHVVLKDSPFYDKLNWKSRIKWKFRIKFWEIIFRRSSKLFFTENEFISKRLRKLFKGSDVTTITNYYNQIFDSPDSQKVHKLPEFIGFQMLDIASPGIHKNQEISLDIARILKDKHPEFKFRFIFTIEENQFPTVPEDLKENFLFIGPVIIAECPSLYQQVDASFQPTLLECFTATYVESMKMERPIITTDLDFAKSLCGDAAIYYKSMDARSAVEAIYTLATDRVLYSDLVEKGKMQLSKFDNQESRVTKLIALCEKQ